LLATPVGIWPSLPVVLAILAAMVGGRTYAMGLNRLIDADIDAKNPRTANREIPAGQVKPIEAWLLVGFSAVLLIAATVTLPPLCLRLLPVAFLILTLYSYMKRFSMLAHLVLGLALASSSVGGWVAVTGSLSIPSIWFGLTVLLWVAGFDIIYACQDYDFDTRFGLKSIPVSFGIATALQISRVCHALTVAGFATLVVLVAVSSFWLWLAVALTGGMLLYEHRLIKGKSHDEALCLDKVNEAFFKVNGQISVLVFVLVMLHKWFFKPV
jgi:4-hydroxybenzoate polyprenyltransferase